MREPHLLTVDEGPERFAGLLDALRAAGLRAGWLDLSAEPTGEPIPSDLAAAAASGALRAVAAGGGRTVAVKALRGAPVLRDLLREHFRGCALVLVRGEVAAPHLALVGDSWTVAPPGEAARRYTTGELVAALRRPRPWLATESETR
jgi:hypothetical protein